MLEMMTINIVPQRMPTQQLPHHLVLVGRRVLQHRGGRYWVLAALEGEVASGWRVGHRLRALKLIHIKVVMVGVQVVVVVLVLVLLLRSWNLSASHALAHLYRVANCNYFFVRGIELKHRILRGSTPYVTFVKVSGNLSTGDILKRCRRLILRPCLTLSLNAIYVHQHEFVIIHGRRSADKSSVGNVLSCLAGRGIEAV